MMISAGDFRKGVTFQLNGEPHVVLDFQHVKPGKGAAFVRTKYRNILTGATREEAFNPSDKFPKAHIETKHMQYLYNDGELFYFMDNENDPKKKEFLSKFIAKFYPQDSIFINKF